MSKKAAAFVTYLSQEPKDLERFLKDPEAVMSEHDLSGKDRQVLKTKDPEKIRPYLGDMEPMGCMDDWPMDFPSEVHDLPMGVPGSRKPK